MSKTYFSYEESEAHQQGHDDQKYHRSNYDHERYSDDVVDIAYWEGRKDEQREQEREANEREQERLQEEQAIMMEEENRFHEDQQARAYEEYQEYLYNEANPDLETVNDFDALMEREMYDAQCQDDEIGITERDLFNDIINEEREEY